MESCEKSKSPLVDVKRNNIKPSSAAVKTKAQPAAAAAVSSTVKDAKTAHHKGRVKTAKSSSLLSSSSTASRSTSSKAKEASSSSGSGATTSNAAPSNGYTADAEEYAYQPSYYMANLPCDSTPGLTSLDHDANLVILNGSSDKLATQVKTEPGFTAADSNSNIPSKSLVPCKVCGDKASGYHYGVTSCEGCKGFFRRSIQKQIEYRCLRDSKCQVIRLNRNRCQFCRFKKCLAVGMSRDSVRYGRVPKRPKERNDESKVTQSEADQSVIEQESKQLAIYDMILNVSQAHMSNCPYTEERTRALLRKPAVFSLSEIDVSENTVDSLEQQKLIMWKHFAEFVTPSVQRIVEFAKRTPGFSDLVQDDQLVLIKGGFFEIWLIHICRMMEPMENTLTFSDGSFVSRQQLDLIFDPDFVTSLFSFGFNFNNLKLNDTEIGIYCAVVLLSTERLGIHDTKFIQQQQDKVIEALKLQLGRNHAGDAHLFSSMLMKLPELGTLGTRHNEHLKWFRGHWAQVKLPPLFAEIFEIPKCDDKL